MAYEKNIQNDKMKTLILMLIGLPLMASTNIDCGGRSFHCVNATHFLICVDVGGGVLATVDQFMIRCPPPTLCRPDNRFECELPPPTQPIPGHAVAVLPIMPVKVKETTEEFLVETIFSNTEVEEHLEISTINTIQDPVTAVTPVKYGLVSETTYNVSGKDQTQLLGSTVDSNNTRTVIVRTISEVDNENNINTLIKSSPTPTSKGYINSTNDYLKNEISSVMSTRRQNIENSTNDIVDIKVKSTISSVLNANMNEAENIPTRTTTSTTNLKSDNVTEVVAVTENFQIYTTLANLNSAINVSEIIEANSFDLKKNEFSAKNNDLISDIKESTNVKIDTLTNHNTTRTNVVANVTTNLQNLEVTSASAITDKGETIETITPISIEPPITDTLTTDYMAMKTTESFSLPEILLTQKQLSEGAVAHTPDSDFFFTTHIIHMADNINSSTYKNITEDVFIDSSTPTSYIDKNEITQSAVIESSTLNDIILRNNDIESEGFNITTNKTTRNKVLTLPTEFMSATETSDIIILNTTDTYKPIHIQPAVSINKETYAHASILEDETESSNKVIVTSPGQLEKKTLDNEEIRNMTVQRNVQTLKTTVDSFIDSIDPGATSTMYNDFSFATIAATIKYKIEPIAPEIKTVSNITTKTENTQDTSEPIEENIYKANEIIFTTIPISTDNTTFEVMDQKVNTDDYSSSRILDSTTKVIDAVDSFTTALNKEQFVMVALAETIFKRDNKTKNRTENRIQMHDSIVNSTTQIISDYHRTGQTVLNISETVTEINMINTPNIMKQYNTTTEGTVTSTISHDLNNPKSHLKQILTSMKPMENVESVSEVALRNESNKVRTSTEPILISSNEVIFNKGANILALNMTQINNNSAANVTINIYKTEQPAVILTKLQEYIVNNNVSSIHTFLETMMTINETSENYNEQTTMETLVVGTTPSDLIYNNSSISISATINTEQKVMSTTESWVGSTPMIKDTEKHSLKAEPFEAKVNVDTEGRFNMNATNNSDVSLGHNMNTNKSAKHNFNHIVTTPHPNLNYESLYELQKINNASLALHGQSQSVVNYFLNDIMPDRKLKYGENTSMATSIFDKYETTEQLLTQYESPPAENVDTTIPISSSARPIKTTEIDFLPVFTIENKNAPENSTLRSYNVFELGVEMTNTNSSMFKRNLSDTINFENVTQTVITVNLASNGTKNSTENHPINKARNESDLKQLLSLGNTNNDAKLKSTKSIPEGTVKSNQLNTITNSYDITKNKNLTDAGIYQSKLTNNGHTEVSDDSLLHPRIILQNPLNDILFTSMINVVEDSTMPTISDTNTETTRNLVKIIDGVVKITYENHTESALFQDSNVTEITTKYFSATKPSVLLEISAYHLNDLNNFSLTTMTVHNIGDTPDVLQNVNETLEENTNLISNNINVSMSIDANRSFISIRNNVNQSDISVELSSNLNSNRTAASSSDTQRKSKDDEISRGLKMMLNAFNTSVVKTTLSNDMVTIKPDSNRSQDNTFEFKDIKPTVNIRTTGVPLIDHYDATSESLTINSDDKRIYNPDDDTVNIDISGRYTSLQVNNSTFGLDSIPYVTPTSLLSTEGQESYSFSIPPEILLTGSTLEDIREETLATNENTNIISESFIKVDTIFAVTTSFPFVASNSIQQNIYTDATSTQHNVHQPENNEDISYIIENNKELDITSLPTNYLISSFDKETTKTYEASTAYTEGVTLGLPQNESEGQITTTKASVIGITDNDTNQTLSKFISKLNKKVDERLYKTLTSNEQEQNQITLKQSASAAASSNTELESINETGNIERPFISKEGTERAMNQTLLDVIEISISTENISLITTDTSNQRTAIFPQGSPTTKKEFTVTPAIGSEIFAEGHTIQALVATTARSFFNGAREVPVANTVKETSPIHTTPETISVIVPPSTTSPMTSSVWESVTTEATAFSCALRPAGRYAEPEDNDCRKFYVCSGMTHPIVVGLCPPNTVFSEIRKQCTRNLSHCIRKNEFKCVSPGRFGDFMQPNLYYICVKKGDVFLRYKLQCQKGYYLNKTTVHCTKLREVTSSNLPVPSSTSLSAEGRKKQHESSSEKTEVFECGGEGTFADPYNCRGYYTCKRVKSSDVKYRRKRKTCDQDEVFDREKKKCVDGESSECRHCDSKSPNVYYVYVRRQEYHWLRFKLQCRVGYILNTTTVRCYKTQSLTSSQSASENESGSADASAGAQTQAFRCAAAGRFPFPEPRDAAAAACRRGRYIECKVTRHNRFKQKRKKCKKFQVFDADNQKCVQAAESLECR